MFCDLGGVKNPFTARMLSYEVLNSSQVIQLPTTCLGVLEDEIATRTKRKSQPIFYWLNL